MWHASNKFGPMSMDPWPTHERHAISIHFAHNIMISRKFGTECSVVMGRGSRVGLEPGRSTAFLWAVEF